MSWRLLDSVSRVEGTFKVISVWRSRKCPAVSPPLRPHQSHDWSVPWTCCLSYYTGLLARAGIHAGHHHPHTACDAAGRHSGSPVGTRCAAGSDIPSPPGQTSPGRVSRPAPGGKGCHRGRRCHRGGRSSSGRSWRVPAAPGRSAPACCATLRNNRRSTNLRGTAGRDVRLRNCPAAECYQPAGSPEGLLSLGHLSTNCRSNRAQGVQYILLSAAPQQNERRRSIIRSYIQFSSFYA